MPDACQSTARPSIPQRILLTGFMGAGKTTVGILLAERLGWRFLDLDQHLAGEHGKSVGEIFADHGEAHFRTLETDLLAQILGAKSIVIALGGGALESSANRDAIAAAADSALVFLDAPLATLLERVQSQPDAPRRPLLADRAAMDARHAARLPHYRIAELHIETSSVDPDAVSDRIVAGLGLDTLAPERAKP